MTALKVCFRPIADIRNRPQPEAFNAAVKLCAAAIAIMLAGCATPVPTIRSEARVLPTSAPTQQQRMNLDLVRQTSEQDLLWSALQQFGEPIVRRALAADVYIFAKHYQGMLPPPPPGAGLDWKYPDPPTAVLFIENGIWVAATREGVRQARPDKVQEIRQVLLVDKFWNEPVWAPPGCTDAGASLLLLKIPRRPEVVRSASCGASGGSEAIVFRALEA